MNLLFYIFFPFFGFLYNLRNFSRTKIRLPLYFFGFLFGYSIVFSGGDLVRYQEGYAEIINFTFSDYLHNLRNTFDESKKFINTPLNTFNSKPDIYALTIGFLVSRFTENARWLFAIISLIYTIIQIKFFEEVFNRFKDKTKGFKLFFVALVFIVPFYVGVTGVRFWPALFIFVWMIYKYTNTGAIKYFLYATLSIAFHYTFIIPCIIALIARFLKINRTIFKILIIFGLLFAIVSSTSSSLDFITTAIDVFDNETISNSSSSYTDEQYIAKRSQLLAETNWYVQARVNLLNIFFYTFFLIDFFNIHKWKKPHSSELFLNLYHFFFLISVFTLGLASLSRFNYVFYMLCILRILQFQVSENQSRLLVFNRIFLFILILNILVSFRGGFYFVDPLLLISPSIALFFIHSDISLSEFIVGH